MIRTIETLTSELGVTNGTMAQFQLHGRVAIDAPVAADC